MANQIPLIVFPANDLEKTKKFFTIFLGAEPYVDGAYYVGYKIGDREVGLDPNGKSVVSYIDVEDIEARLKTLQTAGAEVTMPSKNVGGGILVAQVTIDENVLGLRQKPNA